MELSLCSHCHWMRSILLCTLDWGSECVCVASVGYVWLTQNEMNARNRIISFCRRKKNLVEAMQAHIVYILHIMAMAIQLKLHTHTYTHNTAHI